MIDRHAREERDEERHAGVDADAYVLLDDGEACLAVNECCNNVVCGCPNPVEEPASWRSRRPSHRSR